MENLSKHRGEGLQSWLSSQRLGQDPIPAFLLQGRPQYGTGWRQLRVGVIHSVRDNADRRYAAARSSTTTGGGRSLGSLRSGTTATKKPDPRTGGRAARWLKRAGRR